MPARILSPQFLRLFEDVLTTVQQRQAVDALKDIIAELEENPTSGLGEIDLSGESNPHPVSECISDVRGGYAAACSHDGEGLPSCYGATSLAWSGAKGFSNPSCKPAIDQGQCHLGEALEKCYWQLIKFLRFSTPTRISEAEPYARALLHSKADLREDTTLDSLICVNEQTLVPAIYLAASLSVLTPASYYLRRDKSIENPCTSSRDAEAATLFSRAFEICESWSPRSHLLPDRTLELDVQRSGKLTPKDSIWARACYSALLNRIGRSEDAGSMRTTVRAHPRTLSAKTFRTLVAMGHNLGADETLFQVDILRETAIEAAQNRSEASDASSEEEEFDRLPPLSPCSSISTSSLSSAPCSPVVLPQACSPRVVSYSPSQLFLRGACVPETFECLGDAQQPSADPSRGTFLQG